MMVDTIVMLIILEIFKFYLNRYPPLLFSLVVDEVFSFPLSCSRLSFSISKLG